jgi:hypothetical protein
MKDKENTNRPILPDSSNEALEQGLSATNALLCASCGAAIDGDRSIVKYATAELGTIYEGDGICQECVDKRHDTAREAWDVATRSSYKWKLFTRELKTVIESRRGVTLKRADIFRYVTDDDVLAASERLGA